jgi:hypothetical protein
MHASAYCFVFVCILNAFDFAAMEGLISGVIEFVDGFHLAVAGEVVLAAVAMELL